MCNIDMQSRKHFIDMRGSENRGRKPDMIAMNISSSWLSVKLTVLNYMCVASGLN